MSGPTADGRGAAAPARSWPNRIGDRIQYVLVVTIAACLRRVPLDAVSAGMGALWRWIGPMTHRHRRMLDNLALAMPELPEAERRRIAVGCWRNLGRVAGESLVLDRLAAEKDRILMTPGSYELLATHTGGMVLVSLHLGNWEIVVEGSDRAGRDAMGIYKTLRNPHVDRWLLALRAPLYRGGLIPKNNDAARTLIGLIKRGRTIAMMADLRDSRGIEVPFFGQPAYANPFPAMAARMTGAVLVAGRARRLGGARFMIDVVEIAVPRTADKAADVEAATAEMHRCFERWIREDPEQWMWIQRKWVTRRSHSRVLRARRIEEKAAEEKAAEEKAAEEKAAEEKATEERANDKPASS